MACDRGGGVWTRAAWPDAAGVDRGLIVYWLSALSAFLMLRLGNVGLTRGWRWGLSRVRKPRRQVIESSPHDLPEQSF